MSLEMPEAFKDEFMHAYYTHDVDRIIELNRMWNEFLKGEYIGLETPNKHNK